MANVTIHFTRSSTSIGNLNEAGRDVDIARTYPYEALSETPR